MLVACMNRQGSYYLFLPLFDFLVFVVPELSAHFLAPVIEPLTSVTDVSVLTLMRAVQSILGLSSALAWEGAVSLPDASGADFMDSTLSAIAPKADAVCSKSKSKLISPVSVMGGSKVTEPSSTFLRSRGMLMLAKKEPLL